MGALEGLRVIKKGIWVAGRVELEQKGGAQGGMCTGEEEFPWGFRRLGLGVP